MEEFQKELHEWFEYKDGSLCWRKSRGSNRKKGVSAGTVATRHDGISRYRIMFKGRSYMRSVLVWIYHNGEPPKNTQVDHTDRNSLNDRIENLRLATSAQQQYNTRVKSKTGWKGVYKFGGRWRSKIGIDGKDYCLGLYAEREEAAIAYNLAVWTYFPEFANYNKGAEYWF